MRAPPPEPGDPEEGVHALQEPAQRSRVVPPGGVVQPSAAAALIVVEGEQVHEGAEFVVLELVHQRRGELLPVVGDGGEGRAEGVPGGSAVRPEPLGPRARYEGHQTVGQRAGRAPVQPAQDLPRLGEQPLPGVGVDGLGGEGGAQGAVRVGVVQQQPAPLGRQPGQRVPVGPAERPPGDQHTTVDGGDLGRCPASHPHGAERGEHRPALVHGDGGTEVQSGTDRRAGGDGVQIAGVRGAVTGRRTAQPPQGVRGPHADGRIGEQFLEGGLVRGAGPHEQPPGRRGRLAGRVQQGAYDQQPPAALAGPQLGHGGGAAPTAEQFVEGVGRKDVRAGHASSRCGL